MNWKEVNLNRKIANEEIYIEVADELGLTVELVKSIVKEQADLIFSTIKAGEFEGVILPYLGKVQINARKVQKVYAQKIKKQ